MKMNIQFQPIGIIHTSFMKLEGMPIQPTGAAGATGVVEIFEEYRPGIQDLEGFSHLILLYYFHQSKGYNLHFKPFMDKQPRGLFATRAPKRPNPIGLSVVCLNKVEQNRLYIQDVDILNGTPLLDIKPFVPVFDVPLEVKTGWLTGAGDAVTKIKSDDRFK